METIGICADMLYLRHLTPPDIWEAVFVELRKFAITSVEFSFNNIMYGQVDGISVGSVLGPIIPGIFVGFYEVDLFSKCTVPDVYFHYIDYTFCIFSSEWGLQFFSHLEKKSNFTLPFFMF